jgi:hypothetical protein
MIGLNSANAYRLCPSNIAQFVAPFIQKTDSPLDCVSATVDMYKAGVKKGIVP